MGDVIRDVEFRGMWRQKMAGDPCRIIILPVVRIERHPDEPGPIGKRMRRLRLDARKYKRISDLP